MRACGVYLVEVLVGKLRSSKIPEGQLAVTFRVGRNSTVNNYYEESVEDGIQFNSVLKLNVEGTALETQRCSVTVTHNVGGQKKIFGIAVVSLPKQKNQLDQTFKMSQGEDKKAEIQIKIRISSLEAGKQINSFAEEEAKQIQKINSSSNLKPTSSTTNIKPTVSNSNMIKTISSTSSINLKSKIQQSSNEKNKRIYKLRQIEKTVEINESQLKKLQEERDCFFELYQIQKNKSEASQKFVKHIIKKISQRFPQFLKQIQTKATVLPKVSVQDPSGNTRGKNPNELNKLKAELEEYKRNNDYLKKQIVKLAQSKLPDNSKKADYDAKKLATSKSTGSFQTNPKQQKNPSQTGSISNIFAGVDLKKWLNMSVNQRSEIQVKLKKFGIQVKEKPRLTIQKAKITLDKSYMSLLGNKSLTKEMVLGHKRQINKLFDEIATY